MRRQRIEVIETKKKIQDKVVTQPGDLNAEKRMKESALM